MTHLKKYNGLFVTIEGIDGSGKTFLVKKLKDFFSEKKLDALYTQEPGGTPFGESLLKSFRMGNNLQPHAQFLLYASDRAEHFATKVIPALNTGKVVVSDRSADSSLAYQGHARGVPLEKINSINNWVMNEITPDLVIYMDISIEEAQKRISLRQQMGGTSEYNHLDFLRKVKDAFDKIMSQKKNVLKIDALKPSNTLCQAIYKEIRSLL